MTLREKVSGVSLCRTADTEATLHKASLPLLTRLDTAKLNARMKRLKGSVEKVEDGGEKKDGGDDDVVDDEGAKTLKSDAESSGEEEKARRPRRRRSSRLSGAKPSTVPEQVDTATSQDDIEPDNTDSSGAGKASEAGKDGKQTFFQIFV